VKPRHCSTIQEHLERWWKAERPGRAIAVYDDFSWKEIDEPAATP
jgi:hypothetical protein